MQLPKLTLEQVESQLRGLIANSCIELAERKELEHPYKLTAPIIVTPHSEQDIIRLLSWANEHRVSVIPRGGGTKDALGLRANADIILSMKGLNGIIEHSCGDLTVTVLPGTSVDELQLFLKKEGQFLPLDPPHPEQSTIGGSLSANCTGPRRAMYGSARDYVIAGRVVYPDGRLIRTGAKVVKNVAGYDMNKLFIGAMGTLGVMTEVTLRTRPIPAYSGIVLISGHELQIRNLQESLLDSQLEPSLCEWMNNVIASEAGIPTSGNAVVAVGFDDVTSSVRHQLERVIDYCRTNNLQVLEVIGMYDSRLEMINRHLRNFVPDASQSDSEKLIISLKLMSALTDVPELCARAELDALNAELAPRISGGLYTGISRAAIETEWDRIEAVTSWIRLVQDLLRERAGCMVIEHAPAVLRDRFSVWGDTAPTDALMRGIKQAVDPNRILNNGRFVGGI